MTVGQLMTYGSFFGFIVAGISFVWAVVNRIIDRVAANKTKTIEFQHTKNQQLETQKIQLQKEADKQKQRYVETAIGKVETQVKAIDAKVQTMMVNYGRVDEKLKANVQASERVVKKVECFVDATNKRFETVEKELNIYRTEHIDIGKDLVLLKSLADSIRKKGK